MQSVKNYLFLVSVIALITLAGCAHYRAHPLKKLVTPPVKTTHQAIAFSHHALSKGECMLYLDRDVLAKGYQPVHITFTNNSKNYFTLSKENFSLPYANSDDVAKLVHTNTAGRAAGYGVVGLFIWPFIIPAVVDGIGSSEANHQLDADFAGKALRNQIVAPYSTVHGLIFVPKNEFDANFTMSVTNQETGTSYTLSSSKPEVKL